MVERQWSRKELCHEVETEFTHLDDRVIAGIGCEAAVTARTRCVWYKFREGGESLYGKGFFLQLKVAVF